ncbi:MAG: Holliday junction resolvase-like protein [Bacillota bacterium]
MTSIGMKGQNAAHARRLISELVMARVSAECPCCGERVALKDAGLFYLDEFTPAAEKLFKERQADIRERALELKAREASIGMVSKSVAKSTNIGLILERLAPALRSFRFLRNDCRSLFDPLDYVIFEGLSLKRIVSKILFIDIKTGAARLKARQKEIKTVISAKRLSWHVYKPMESI